jgi:Flp pilus assembly protein TadD
MPRKEKMDTTIEALRSKAEAFPNDVTILNALAKALCDSVWQDTRLWDQRYSEALVVLRRALQKDKNNTVTLTNLGAAMLDIGKHGDALKILKQAEAVDSTDRNLYFNIAVAMMNISSATRTQAKPYFDKAASLNPYPETIQSYFDAHAH